eukprot:Stramenopile-MAST_4_protein_2029
MIKTAHAFPVHTRRGKLLRVVREHYLRDDLGCGTTCWQQEQGVLHLSENLPRPVDANYVDYLVLDTNVVLKQIDLLELNVLPLSRLIIMQTVLEEVQHKSNSIYNRLVQLVQHSERQTILFPNEHHTETHVDRLPEESANDRNDRAIRTATAWFAKRYGHQADILLLTNDRACREAARQEGLHSISIDAYAKKHSGGFPNLLDFLARGVDEDIGGVPSSDGGADAAKTYWYEPHRGVAEIENQLKAGKLYRGTLRVNKNYPSEATLSIRTSKTEFYAVVHGMSARNRAIDGDVVAVRILQTHEVADYARKDKRRRSEETMQDGEMVGMWGGQTEEVEKDDTLALDDAEKQGGDRDAPATAEITKQGKVKAAVHVSVVGILRRNLRPFCGSILGTSVRSGSEECLFVPVDPRIPCTYIHTRQSKQLIGKRIVVVIDGWGVKSAYPTGHYLKTVGDIGDRETETQVVLIEHDIPTDEFSKAVYACLPPASWVVTPENSAGRLDLRHLPVCSIDPPGCKDIDDALHSRPLPNGNLEVGVHIADVTHFVKPGTAIDKEAANRSTSTYLVDRRLDMLPGLLTTTLCSLVSGVDRFAFSVIWEMTQDGEIVKTKFTKSIIHSRASLTYDQAQEMLDDPVGKTGTIPDAVRALNKIARAQRKKRMDLGALTLASPEVKFSLDDDSRDPTDVKMYVLKEANQLVEEFMLLGNISVAEKIVSTFPRFSLLRRHPEPNAHNFESLIAAANLVGVHIEVETSKQLADSLDLAVKHGDPFFNKLIRIMTTRCMSQAVYFCSGEYSAAEYRHYGLAAKLYTHFTSPIRRYADVIVHRLLAAAIGIEPLPLTYESRSAMRKLCDNMNKRHHMAQLAGRASVALHTLIYFDGRPTVTTASILKVKSDSIVVLVPKFGMEAVIPLTLKKDGVCVDYTFEEDQMLLVHNSEKRKNLRIFDPVTIKIEVVSKGFHRKELKITLEWDSGPAAGRNKRALEIQDGGVATKKKQKSKGRRQ